MRAAVAFLVLFLPAMLAAAAARADACGPRLIVEFVEAPTDVFELRNAGDTGWAVTHVEIDLGSAAGGLIFDVTDGGAGVSGYHPYAEAGGTAITAGRSAVTDGDSRLTISFARFRPGELYRFGIDVDSTGPVSAQTWVSGTDIAGGTIRVLFTGAGGETAERTARFETDSLADTGRNESCLVS